MSNFQIRKANLSDIDFLVTTIVEAEKSGTDKLGLANTFGLNEKSLRDYLTQMLNEEIDGCEFSVNSFILMCDGDKPVAAIASWIEGKNEDMLPSSILKSNLLSYTIPHSSVNLEYMAALKDLHISRKPNSIQIEYAYVDTEYRGKGLIDRLFRHVMDDKLEEIQIQVFGNNALAIKIYSRLGFVVKERVESNNMIIREIMPDNVKFLMEKLNNNDTSTN